MKHSLKMDKME